MGKAWIYGTAPLWYAWYLGAVHAAGSMAMYSSCRWGGGGPVYLTSCVQSGRARWPSAGRDFTHTWILDPGSRTLPPDTELDNY